MKHQIQTNKDGSYPKFKAGTSFNYTSSNARISSYIGNRFAMHWHSEIEITLIDSGNLFYQTKDMLYSLKAGDIVYCNSSVVHSAWNHGETDCEYIPFTFSPELIFGEFNGAIDKKYFQEILFNEAFPNFVWTSEHPDHSAIRELLLECHRLFKEKENFYELRIKANLCTLWTYVFKAYMQKKEELGFISYPNHVFYVQKALEYIRQNYAEKITLGNIAQYCGISSSELCRTFKKTMHRSPFKYLMYLRVNQSLPLLAAGKHNITEVSFLCGFQNSGYFCRIFKRITDTTPSQYIKKVRSNSK